MAAIKNYNRDKEPDTNVTPMATTLLTGEKPDAPTAIGGTGTTADLDLRVQVDADPSAGVAVLDMFQLETAYVLSATRNRLSITVTPILGDGSPGEPITFTADHDQSVDAWQVAAGFPRVA